MRVHSQKTAQYTILQSALLYESNRERGLYAELRICDHVPYMIYFAQGDKDIDVRLLVIRTTHGYWFETSHNL